MDTNNAPKIPEGKYRARACRGDPRRGAAVVPSRRREVQRRDVLDY